MRAAFRRLVPAPLKTTARAVVSLAMFSDAASVRRYAMCREHGPRPAGTPETVSVRPRKIGHRSLDIRTVGSDARVLFDALVHEYHLPPGDVAASLRNRRDGSQPWILDLGANIGVTMAHYAHLFPDAMVVGVELDAGNAALCRRNVAAWAPRCTVIEGAVWTEDGVVEYELQPEAQYAMAARPVSAGGQLSLRQAAAFSLNGILAHHRAAGPVDFLKMDVEGAERELLTKNVDWASRVRAMKVELHGDYAPAACVADLRHLGFAARPDTERAHCVIGVRR